MRSTFMIATLGVAAGLASGAPAGAELIYTSSEGHQYRYSLNENGAVLESLYPVARFVGSGASTEIVTGIEVLYLGRDCDAFSRVLGKGRWAWANGGFVVLFDTLGSGAYDVGGQIGFPRQGIDANNGLRCQW